MRLEKGREREEDMTDRVNRENRRKFIKTVEVSVKASGCKGQCNPSFGVVWTPSGRPPHQSAAS